MALRITRKNRRHKKINPLVDIMLFAFLIATALGIAYLRHLFAVVMLAGMFSLLSALLLLSMDAADVAFTEAAVGAGIATILMLGAMALTERQEKPLKSSMLKRLPALAVAGSFGALLIYAMFDAPPFGDPFAPAQVHVAPYYIEQTAREIDVPNLVTAILASYRGFDTLGEVVVIFTAGIGVALLLGGFVFRERSK
ncbi:MAG: DUF4040 domain-containing protein [Hyphomicrobiales bacterium]|nr:DUF4040 domain-containing protein [Hyphomicrobiales bacterium]